MSEPSPSPDAAGELLARPRRRRWRWALVSVGAIVALGLFTALPALMARGRLDAGRTELLRARDLLVAGNVSSALAAFERSEDAFGDAHRWARSPVLWAVGQVPLLGRSADALAVLAAAAERTARAGGQLAAAIGAMPGGIEALAPRDGRLPVEAIASLAPSAAAARTALEQAYDDVQALPTSFLIGPIASARDEALGELGRALEAARAAEALTAALPSLLGAEDRRRYFVAVQATSELRGTGGLIGAFAILTASDGALRMGPMRSIHTLPGMSQERAPAPPADFGEPFSRFGGPGYWLNLNMVPHAPTAATLVEALYEDVTGEHLDGVVFVDPQALAEMLEATGPVQPPSFDRTLEAETIVDYLTNESYLQFEGEAERKRVLGAAALVVWNRFMDGTEPSAAFRALADAAAGGHIVLHATTPNDQSALSAAGIAGAIDVRDGNLFGVFASNADGTKVDYYLQRDLLYEVELGPDGDATSAGAVEIVNTAPVDAEPNYVFGPYEGTGLGPGDSRAFVTSYCAPACTLESSTLDGEPAGVEINADRGLPIFSTYVRTDAGSQSSLLLGFRQVDAWEGDELGGVYRLAIRGQPTIRPTTATIVVRVPAGMRIVDTSVPMEVEGDEATWRGTLGSEQRFVIRFQKPFPSRLWSELANLLSSPAFQV